MRIFFPVFIVGPSERVTCREGSPHSDYVAMAREAESEGNFNVHHRQEVATMALRRETARVRSWTHDELAASVCVLRSAPTSCNSYNRLGAVRSGLFEMSLSGSLVGGLER